MLRLSTNRQPLAGARPAGIVAPRCTPPGSTAWARPPGTALPLPPGRLAGPARASGGAPGRCPGSPAAARAAPPRLQPAHGPASSVRSRICMCVRACACLLACIVGVCCGLVRSHAWTIPSSQLGPLSGRGFHTTGRDGRAGLAAPQKGVGPSRASLHPNGQDREVDELDNEVRPKGGRG